jgi:signal recognition particle subunit SRP54
MASRILGMGDVLSLIEKAQDAFDDKAAADLERKVRKHQLTLDDYLDQMRQLSKMGSIADVLRMIPGLGSKISSADIDEAKIAKAQARNCAIILSMTPQERRSPEVLNASRKRRVAAGCGATVQDINILLRQYDQARSMMKQMMGSKGRGMKLPFKM